MRNFTNSGIGSDLVGPGDPPARPRLVFTKQGAGRDTLATGVDLPVQGPSDQTPLGGMRQIKKLADQNESSNPEVEWGRKQMFASRPGGWSSSDPKSGWLVFGMVGHRPPSTGEVRAEKKLDYEMNRKIR